MTDFDKTVIKRYVKTAAERQQILTIIDGLPADLGKIIELNKASMLIGRGEDADIRLEDFKVSQQHALLKLIKTKKESAAFQISDYGSTNGVFLNGEKIKRRRLRNGDLIEIGDTVFRFSEAGSVEKKIHQQILALTYRDELTGIFNRRFLIIQLQNQFNFYQRYQRPFSLIMIDIDYFKQLNDIFGHLAADLYLKHFTANIKNLLRSSDIFGRFGGEEFLLILPETGISGAETLAQRIVAETEAMILKAEGKLIKTTVSCGITAARETDQNLQQILQRVDSALYQAKESGRNCVEKK